MKAQEYINENYSQVMRKYVKELNIVGKNLERTLDLSDFIDLEKLDCSLNKITTLILNNNPQLNIIFCQNNQIVNVDFLTQLSNPHELEKLLIYNNNIQPTNIEVFSKLSNIKRLKLGTTEDGIKKNKRNKFYGSFESWKGLTKLESICIEATDVDQGLEYLPMSLVESTTEEAKNNKKKGGYLNIECSPHGTDAKCKIIQDELRPLDYDLGA